MLVEIRYNSVRLRVEVEITDFCTLQSDQEKKIT